MGRIVWGNGKHVYKSAMFFNVRMSLHTAYPLYYGPARSLRIDASRRNIMNGWDDALAGLSPEGRARTDKPRLSLGEQPRVHPRLISSALIPRRGKKPDLHRRSLGLQNAILLLMMSPISFWYPLGCVLGKSSLFSHLLKIQSSLHCWITFSLIQNYHFHYKHDFLCLYKNKIIALYSWNHVVYLFCFLHLFKFQFLSIFHESTELCNKSRITKYM